jgi:hypothetical protein
VNDFVISAYCGFTSDVFSNGAMVVGLYVAVTPGCGVFSPDYSSFTNVTQGNNQASAQVVFAVVPQFTAATVNPDVCWNCPGNSAEAPASLALPFPNPGLPMSLGVLSEQAQ